MSEPSPAISVRNLGKRYSIASQNAAGPPPTTLGEAILSKLRGGLRKNAAEKRTDFWALKDVSFDVHKGDVVGVIGRNGAGKSTLLKTLSRITAPTTGSIKLYGRVGSLLEVGTGFHPELTGREHIFLTGSILGMRRGEIEKQFDAIVEFAELSQFVDTPVKRYSSGMYVRLAFAVAAHLNPEILIIDEVLAVGDMAFQQKSLGKMKDVASSGRTVVFVSHNMQAIRTLCRSGIVMEKGAVAMTGDVDRCVARYIATTGGDRFGSWQRPDEISVRPFSLMSVTTELKGRQPNLTLDVKIEARSVSDHKPGFVAVDILDCTGTTIMQAIPTCERIIEHRTGPHEIGVEIDLPPLIPGQYSVSVWVGVHNNETLDWAERCVSFEVHDSPTPQRTFPHTTDHGAIVPTSRLSLSGSTVAESEPALVTVA
jgi:lipopolysaccharide transport system ATP-binding protein